MITPSEPYAARPGSHPSRRIIFLVCGALSALGCVGTTDTGQQGETGSVSVDLVLVDGIEIAQVGWQITGNDMNMSGDIDVSAPGSTASVEVFGLPPGKTDYTVTLTATSTDTAVSCEGSAPFNIEIDESTDLVVMLNCKQPPTLGGVRVNGEVNYCTELTKVVLSPLETSVGNDIRLLSQAFDQEGDAITYSWTAEGGSIADPTAANTTYTCQDVGQHMVTILATDNDVYCTVATWTVPVTCVAECTSRTDCDDGNPCTTNPCVDGMCVLGVFNGAPCEISPGFPGFCRGAICVSVCRNVDCPPRNACVQRGTCNPATGECEAGDNKPAGAFCFGNAGGVCDGSGNCVECNNDGQCDAGESCVDGSCVGE